MEEPKVIMYDKNWEETENTDNAWSIIIKEFLTKEEIKEKNPELYYKFFDT